MVDHPLLETVSRLGSLDALTIKDIEEALNISLVIREKATSQFYMSYGEKKEKPGKATTVKAVELRAFTDKAVAKGILLSLMPPDDATIDIAALVDTFGHPSEVDVPPPRGLSPPSVVYIYRLPTSSIRIQLTAEPEPKIRSITIERTE